MSSKDLRRAKPSMIQVMGRALHPILAAFPIVLYTVSTGCYIAYAAGLQSFWFKAAFYAGAAGVFAAVAAAIPSILDYKRVARTHVAFNLLAWMLFATNTILLWNAVTPEVLRVEAFDTLDHTSPMWVAVIGMISTLTAVYLSAKLAQQIGADAPSVKSRRTSPIHPRVSTT